MFIICIAIILIGIFYYLNKNDVILSKSLNDYPIKETIQILSNGDIERSSIVDELTINGAQKEKFEKIGKLSNSELNDLTSMLDQLKNQKLKTENFSQNYGISIKYNNEKSLYGAEYFEQKNVDELNNFVQNILEQLNASN